MPDIMQIGEYSLALTINLLLTGAIGLGFSIALFYWTRKVKGEDAIKRELIEAREKADKERHEALLKSVDAIKEELGDKSDLLFRKVEDFCKVTRNEHAKMKRNFWKHTHIKVNSGDREEDKIYIPEYEP